ncbi:N-acetylmuramoyl-L-alanine amidase [bacterium]|nr:N-acetylmuramoyl-L-alanine amidase [candidate division CSSED10-310 bacterium]
MKTHNDQIIGFILLIICMSATFPGDRITYAEQNRLEFPRENPILVFQKEDQPIAVTRARYSLGLNEESCEEMLHTRDELVRIIRAWVAGPVESEQELGVRAWLPVVQPDWIRVDGQHLEIRLTLPAEFLQRQLTWGLSDAVLRALSFMVTPDMNITQLSILARVPLNEYGKNESFLPETAVSQPVWMPPTDPDGYAPLDAWIDPGPVVPPKPFENDSKNIDLRHTQSPTTVGTGHNQPGQPGVPGQGMYPGSLTGKSVFLSQSHGWYSNTSYWLTQRPNTNDIVEDFINAEAINQYLVYYLGNAGAGVYTCRERDLNNSHQVVDNTDAGYSDSGSWSTSTSTAGFYGSNYRTHPVTSSGHEFAVWTLTPAVAGYYEIYVWYTGGSNRAVDARYTIHHNGGDTIVLQNQQRDGYTWKSLGRYALDPDDSTDRRQLVLSSEGSVAGQYVIADAVRIGGGMGSIADPMVSGRPRWEESGRYFAEYMGCTTCGTSTVAAMPKYAAWENEAWEDSVYVSWHTNAPDPGSGTSTYIHNTAPYANSDILQDWVHDEIINDIRAGYDAGWQDRGKLSANFGEINTANNNEMPAMLIELAFHDTPADALYLKDPKFRMLASRAIYQGIEKFFAWKDGRSPVLLPEPPGSLCVRNTGSGMVHLTWTEPPANSGDDLLGDSATGYRIYVSETGAGFSDGIPCTGTSTSLGPFPAGAIRFFRVTATNDGGESFPTPVLVAKIPGSSESVDLLIVDAFDRLDRYALIPQYESSALGTDVRMFLNRMNTYSYCVIHAAAAAGYPCGFDSCVNEVVESGAIDLNEYKAVDWIMGEESTVDETFSSVEQAVVASYLDDGGGLFVSGSEITWDLDAYGSISDRSFCGNYLKAGYDVDDAGSDTLVPVAGGIFDGLGTIVFDYDQFEIYASEYPDGLTTENGSVGAMMFAGTSFNAVVVFDGSFRVVTMGCPFETILSSGDRTAVMNKILHFLIPPALCIHHGDVNFSGSISATDAQLAFQIVLGLLTPSTQEACAADCDGNGSVTAGDSQMIFYVALGQEPSCADGLP